MAAANAEAPALLTRVQAGAALFQNDAWPKALAMRVIKHVPRAVADVMGGALLVQLSDKQSVNPWSLGALMLAYAAPHLLAQQSPIAESVWQTQLRAQMHGFVAAHRAGQPALWQQLRAAPTDRNVDINEGLLWLADTMPGQLGQTLDVFGGLAIQLAVVSLLVDVRLGAAFVCALGVALAAGNAGRVIMQRTQKPAYGQDPHGRFTQVRKHVFDKIVLDNRLNTHRFEAHLHDSAQGPRRRRACTRSALRCCRHHRPSACSRRLCWPHRV